MKVNPIIAAQIALNDPEWGGPPLGSMLDYFLAVAGAAGGSSVSTVLKYTPLPNFARNTASEAVMAARGVEVAMAAAEAEVTAASRGAVGRIVGGMKGSSFDDFLAVAPKVARSSQAKWGLSRIHQAMHITRKQFEGAFSRLEKYVLQFEKEGSNLFRLRDLVNSEHARTISIISYEGQILSTASELFKSAGRWAPFELRELTADLDIAYLYLGR